jgi:primase-polymerase (primpol)-like protein
MRQRARWVGWKPVPRGGRVTKMPVQVDGTVASTTDAATWAPYEKVAHLERKGFVLGEGIGCIDLDHCLIDGVLTGAAAKFLAALPPTYIEVSPGGDGLHVFGLLPAGHGTRRVVDGLSVETYSVGRYITVTGRAFEGSVSKLADLSAVT